MTWDAKSKSQNVMFIRRALLVMINWTKMEKFGQWYYDYLQTF